MRWAIWKSWCCSEYCGGPRSISGPKSGLSSHHLVWCCKLPNRDSGRPQNRPASGTRCQSPIIPAQVCGAAPNSQPPRRSQPMRATSHETGSGRHFHVSFDRGRACFIDLLRLEESRVLAAPGLILVAPGPLGQTEDSGCGFGQGQTRPTSRLFKEKSIHNDNMILLTERMHLFSSGFSLSCQKLMSLRTVICTHRYRRAHLLGKLNFVKHLNRDYQTHPKWHRSQWTRCRLSCYRYGG